MTPSCTDPHLPLALRPQSVRAGLNPRCPARRVGPWGAGDECQRRNRSLRPPPARTCMRRADKTSARIAMLPICSGHIDQRNQRRRVGPEQVTRRPRPVVPRTSPSQGSSPPWEPIHSEPCKPQATSRTTSRQWIGTCVAVATTAARTSSSVMSLSKSSGLVTPATPLRAALDRIRQGWPAPRYFPRESPTLAKSFPAGQQMPDGVALQRVR